MKQIILSSLFALCIQIGIGQNQTQVLISTPYGDMVVELYNQTPGHRDNFIKHVKNGDYNGTIFHRVIKDFMIQGGNLGSKFDNKGTETKGEEALYTIPAEINPTFYHKKGALAAARLGDNVNPLKASSGSEFYIVQGRPYNAEVLSQMEMRANGQLKNKLYGDFLGNPDHKAFLDRYQALRASSDTEGLKALYAEIEPKLDEMMKSQEMKYSPAQIEAYGSLGGTPHLDGGYTVFGEVVKGLEVIDKIAAVAVDGSKPVENVVMTLSIIEAK